MRPETGEAILICDQCQEVVEIEQAAIATQK